jgi:hypothetical protein
LQGLGFTLEFWVAHFHIMNALLPDRHHGSVFILQTQFSIKFNV